MQRIIIRFQTHLFMKKDELVDLEMMETDGKLITVFQKTSFQPGRSLAMTVFKINIRLT